MGSIRYRATEATEEWLKRLEETKVKGLLPKEVVLDEPVSVTVEVDTPEGWTQGPPIMLPAGTYIDLWVNYSPKNGGGKNAPNRATLKLPDGSQLRYTTSTRILKRIPPKSGVQVGDKVRRRR